MRLDDVVDVTTLGGDERIGEAFLELFDLLFARRFGVLRATDLPAIDDVHRSFGAHDGDLGGWISEVHIRAKMLRAHYTVRSSIGFACDDGDLRYGRLR